RLRHLFFLAERQTSRRRAAASAVSPSEGGAWPVGMAILPLPAVGDLTGPTRLSPRRTLPGPSRWLPRPATLRRRPQGMWGRGKPEKVNGRAPDRLDGNQVGRGVIWTGCRLGPSTDAAPDRAAEATSRKAGDGRHCSWNLRQPAQAARKRARLRRVLIQLRGRSNVRFGALRELKSDI